MTTKVRWLSLMTLTGLVLTLSSCAPALEIMSALAGVPTTTYDSSYYPSYDSYTLEVTNLCGGADEYVDVYVDGSYYGVVYTYQTFYGIPYGVHTLTAEGTDYGGSYFSEAYFADGDYVWTLC
jgi:hypothetical protein